jgi:hypothetical protein
MIGRRRTCPFWFELLVAVATAVALRALDHALAAHDVTAGHGPPVQLAFWQFLIGVAEWIWNGFQAALSATVQFLVWAYGALTAAVTILGNGLAAAGHALLVALKRVWDFFGAVYEDVLKPAWQKFWGWFDKFTKWLDRTVGPVLRWLQRVRDTLVTWWKTWIRPWLDLIDVTRKLLSTLGQLGLQWARALDARLGAIEEAIDKPFRFVLAQLNQVIDIVDRIVTFDGLLQRVALIRSMARDYEYAWRAIANPWQAAFDHNSTPPIDREVETRTAAQVASDYGAYVTTGGGNRAAQYGNIRAYVQKEFGGG